MDNNQPANPIGAEAMREALKRAWLEGAADRMAAHENGEGWDVDRRWAESAAASVWNTRLPHSTPGDAEVRKALKAIANLRQHSREDDADNAATMEDMARQALATPSGRAQGEVGLRKALDMCRAIIKFHVKPGKCCTVDGKVVSAMDAYNAAVEALSRQGQGAWTPIATAPKDGSTFLGYHAEGASRTGAWFALVDYSGDEAWPWEDGEGKHPANFLTHWQPLPAAPPAQDQGE